MDKRTQLYLENKGLIYKIACKYAKTKEDREDLTQEGYIALIRAYETYQDDTGVKFSTYAGIIIERHIQRYINKNSPLSGGIAKKAEIAKYKRFREEYYINYGRYPAYKDTAFYLDMDIQSVKELEQYAHQSDTISTDIKMYDDTDETLGELLPDSKDTELMFVEGNYKDCVYKELHREIDTLEAPQREIVKARYTDDCVKSFKALCGELGRSEQDIKNTHKRVLNQLRKKCINNPLLSEYAEQYIYSAGLKNYGFHTTWTSSTEHVALKRLEAVGY